MWTVTHGRMSRVTVHTVMDAPISREECCLSESEYVGNVCSKSYRQYFDLAGTQATIECVWHWRYAAKASIMIIDSLTQPGRQLSRKARI